MTSNELTDIDRLPKTWSILRVRIPVFGLTATGGRP
jgi:hypothetical protein